MYKCDRLADNCGICLTLNLKFECGWCSETNSCTTLSKCDASQNWLNRSSICPWPKITKVSQDFLSASSKNE